MRLGITHSLLLLLRICCGCPIGHCRPGHGDRHALRHCLGLLLRL